MENIELTGWFAMRQAGSRPWLRRLRGAVVLASALLLVLAAIGSRLGGAPVLGQRSFVQPVVVVMSDGTNLCLRQHQARPLSARFNEGRRGFVSLAGVQDAGQESYVRPEHVIAVVTVDECPAHSVSVLTY